MAELDLSVNAVGCGGVLDVVRNRLTVGDSLLLTPRLPRKTESVQVRIRADAGVLEEIPCAAYGVSCFEYCISFVRCLGLKAVGCVDARDAGSYDYDIVGTIRGCFL